MKTVIPWGLLVHIDISDYSGFLPDAKEAAENLAETFKVLPTTKEASENLRNTLRKNHHGKDCIVCFEKECVCKPRG